MFSAKVEETALGKGGCLTHAHCLASPLVSCQIVCLRSVCPPLVPHAPPLIHVLFGVSISLFSLTFFLIFLEGSDTKIFTFLFDLTQSSVPKIPMIQKISQFFVLEVYWIVLDTWN